MLIRLILLSGIVAIGGLVFQRRRRLPIHLAIVFALLGAGGAAVMFPDATTRIANALGVGRGADLVTYIAIVTVMFVLVHYYTKFVELQQQVTRLTRELAMLRADADEIAERVAAGPAAPPGDADAPAASAAAQR